MNRELAGFMDFFGYSPDGFVATEETQFMKRNQELLKNGPRENVTPWLVNGGSGLTGKLDIITLQQHAARDVIVPKNPDVI